MSEAVTHQRGDVGNSMVVGASIAAWSIGVFVYYLVAGRLLGPDAYGLVAALQSVIVLAFFDPSSGKAELSLLNKFGLILVMAASLAYSYIQFQAGSSKPISHPQKIK